MTEKPDILTSSEIIDTKAVLSLDLDGCIVAKWRDEHTDLQLKHLKLIRRKIEKLRNHGIETVINTGRGVKESWEIAQILGVKTVICENGAVLVENGETTILLPDKQKEAVSLIKNQIQTFILDSQNSLWDNFEALEDKQTMFTVQIPDPHRGTEEAQKDLEKIKTLLNPWQEQINSRQISIITSSNAIDIIPNWGKDKGLKKYCQDKNLPDLKIGAIDDSVVEPMQAADFWMTPFDAKPSLKKAFDEREKTHPGSTYVSQRRFSLGTIEAMHQFQKIISLGNNFFGTKNPHAREGQKYTKEEYYEALRKAGLLND